LGEIVGIEKGTPGNKGGFFPSSKRGSGFKVPLPKAERDGGRGQQKRFSPVFTSYFLEKPVFENKKKLNALTPVEGCLEV
jgi:hypothetical protein